MGLLHDPSGICRAAVVALDLNDLCHVRQLRLVEVALVGRRVRGAGQKGRQRGNG